MNLSGCKFFVCVFMSHGQKNGIVSASDRDFHLKKCIIDPIMRNRSLNGIPKIFITVACRGSQHFDSNYYHQEADELDRGRDDITDEQYKKFDYGNYSQGIISYSTYDGHVSRRTPSGTYFIQQFCTIMDKEYGSNAKIHSIFAKVNGELQQRFNQIPVFESTMGDICLKDLACDLDDDIDRPKSPTNNDTGDIETGERPFFGSACSKNRSIYRVKFASEFMCICVESHDSIPTIEEFINAVKFKFKIDDRTDFAIKDHLGCVISDAITFEEYMLNIFDSQQTILEIDCELRGFRPVENPSSYTDHMEVPIYENADAFDVNVLAKDLVNYFKHQTHISCHPSGVKLIDRYHIGENPIMEVGHAKLIAHISANHLMFLKHNEPSVEDRILWTKVICTVFPQLTAEYYSVLYDPRRGDGFLEEQLKLLMNSKP
ncbi:uncharacterized protein LOC119066343 [Bradysia coprophila]|uniref:uncharacterized protein LOC119066343 n=1 Tax=Bradysia coprophila TaxID=38358 RepID=UPI00187DB9CD|nr:uncharacterized protein LOC119066343 [Bradysia coprophila]